MREAVTAFTDLNAAWGQNMAETKPVYVEVHGLKYPLTHVAASFHDGAFCLILRSEAPCESE